MFQRWIRVFVVVVLVGSVLSTQSQAQELPPDEVADVAVKPIEAGEGIDDAPAEPVVRTGGGPGTRATDPIVPAAPKSAEAERPGWESVVAESLTRPGEDQKVGDSPVTVKVADNATNRGGDTRSRVNVLPVEIASQLSPFAAAVSFDFVDTDKTKVSPEGDYELSFDLTDVNLGPVPDIRERLRVTRYVGCEAFRPEVNEDDAANFTTEELATLGDQVICESAVEVPATFNVSDRKLVVDIDEKALEDSEAARRDALRKSGVPTADLDPKRGRTLAGEESQAKIDPGRGLGQDETPAVGGPRPGAALAAQSLQAGAAAAGFGAGPVILGLTSGASSSSGNFGALPVPTLTDAQVGLFTGSAELSYPIPAPAAAAGPSPSVALVYSSGSVDGMTVDTANQPGLFGVGWSLAGGGSINRHLTGCNDPLNAPGDLCISSAPDEAYTLTLAGRSSKLIKSGTGTGYTEFRLQSDPFWRIRLNTGLGVTNPDHLDQWWSVETPDGTVYKLGTQTASVDWLPVWYPSGGCTAQYALCDTARRWNLDTVTDVHGNEMVFDWDQESNWYNARGISIVYSREYIRSSNLRSITYGANPTQSAAANARIVLDYEVRCGASLVYGNCEWADDYLDTPTDLWCGPETGAIYPTVCDENAPTFWTQLQFTGALSQVADGSGGWVTTAHHDPIQSFERDDTEDEFDSPSKLVLFNMNERPIYGNAASTDGEYGRYGFNRLLASDYDGQSGVVLTDQGHDIGSNTAVGSIKDGDWVRFDDVWLGSTGAVSKTVTLRYSAFRDGKIEIRKGSATGTVLATHTVTGTTADRYNFKTVNLALTQDQTGVDDIYIVAEDDAGQQFTLWQWIQFGRNNTSALPEVGTVDFYSGGFDFRENLLNNPGGDSEMIFARIKKVTNQLGGTTTYTYGQDLTCIGHSTPINGTWDLNDRDCFPQSDTSGTDYAIFHKWPVQTMLRDGSVSTGDYAPDVTTSYAYQSAGWGFADATWNEFRGYNIVTVTDGAGKTEHRFHQGLHGEPADGGGTHTVNVVRSDSTTISDHYALRGRPYEIRRLNLSSAEFSRDWTLYENSETVAGQTDRDDPRFVAADDVDTWVDAGTTTTLMTYGSWGQPLSVNEQGSTASTDNRTTVSSYYNADTGATLGDWRGPQPCVTATRTGDNTTAPSPTSAAGFDRYSRSFYDGVISGACTAASVDETIPTRTQQADTSTGRLTTNYEIDARGRVKKITDPEANETEIAFDAPHGQVTSTTNPKGWVSSVAYDNWRRPDKTTDVNSRDTTTEFDEYSRVIEIIEPGDNSTNPTLKVTYDQAARPAWVQTKGRLTGSTYTNSAEFYDGFGNSILTRSLAPDTNRNWASAQRYDDVGRPQRSSSSYFIYDDNVTTFAYPTWSWVPHFSETLYDAMSRPYEVYTKKGVSGTISTQFTEKSRYTAFTVSFYDKKNLRTNTAFDGLGRSTEVKEVSLSNLTTSYTHNAADDLLTVNGPDNLITTITYDIAGRKLTMDDPDTGDWAYTYTDNSQLETQTDPSTTVLTYAYDKLDRPTSRKQGSTVLAQWAYDPVEPSFAHDNRGLLRHSAAHSAAGTVYQIYSYDELGRVERQESEIPHPTITARWNFVTEYDYRDDHQIDTISQPSWVSHQTDEVLTYTYNRAGLQTDLDSNREGKIVDDVTWSQAGNMRTMHYGPAGADGVVDIRYDQNTLRITENRGGTTTSTGLWQKLFYWYDNNGNITRIRDYRNSNQRQCFSYDALDRLTTAYTDSANCDGYTAKGAGNYNDTYTYEASGNINTKTGDGTYTYGDANHKHAVTSTSQGSSFVYDTDGNMTSRNVSGQSSQTLTWNEDQRLEKLAISGGTTTEFLYDADGNRVRRQTGSANTYYMSGTEFHFDGTGYFRAWYTLNGQRVAYREGATVTWLFADYVGSSSLTRTEAGTNSIQRYTPWGELRTNGNLTTDRHYTGQIADQETGLAFYNARYYDPTIGRFISPDTIIPNPRNGQDYNRYSYVRNNPINHTDPSGKEVIGDDGFNCSVLEHRSCNTIKARRQADGTWQFIRREVAEGGGASPIYDPTSYSDDPYGGGDGDYSLSWIATGLRAGLLDERSCRANEGSGGFEGDLGCVAELGMVACFGPIKAACKGAGKGGKFLKGLFRKAPNGLAAFSRSSIDDAVTSVSRAHNDEISVGARAIDKRLGAKSVPFQGMEATTANAQALVTDILASPTRTVFGQRTYDVYNAAGQGARFDVSSNRFITFLDETIATR